MYTYHFKPTVSIASTALNFFNVPGLLCMFFWPCFTTPNKFISYHIKFTQFNTYFFFRCVPYYYALWCGVLCKLIIYSKQFKTNCVLASPAPEHISTGKILICNNYILNLFLFVVDIVVCTFTASNYATANSSHFNKAMFCSI